jgi:hypothetical protein
MSWILAGVRKWRIFPGTSRRRNDRISPKRSPGAACATQAGMLESGHSQWKRRVEACASLARKPRSDTASNMIF